MASQKLKLHQNSKSHLNSVTWMTFFFKFQVDRCSSNGGK